MRKYESFAKQNKGSALIAVLIILTFVSVVALIITKITMTNIEMKEVQSSTRKNFYNTEDIMDMMKSGLSEISAKAVKESYSDVLENYSLYISEGKNLQEQFQIEYLEKLEDRFWDNSVAKNISTDDIDPNKKLYTTAKYKVDVVKDCIKDKNASTSELNAKRECFKTSESDAEYDIDYKKGVLILRNIKVSHEENTGYGTEIKTDIVFEAPKMVFDGGAKAAAFMKYALIADDMIDILANNINVTGNVYAGANGIKSSQAGSNVLFNADTIITRGDIVADNGTNLQIKGGSASDSGIWTQNIKTTGKNSKLSVRGTSYVADDLSIDGSGNTVKLSGDYYGYNFQKNYGEKESDNRNDAAYNSAITINGKESKLDMTSIDGLMLSGRTFIARGESSLKNSDIAMGESLAVKINQLAYYVAENYLDNSIDPAKKFTADGIKKYEESINVSNVSDYLDIDKQVIPYYYNMNNAVDTSKPFVNYYLNFKSEQKANEFFAAYYKANKKTVNSNADIYATKDALIVDKNKIMTFGGNVLYREKANADLQLKTSLSVDSSDLDKDGVYFKISARYAKKYKALQLGLTTTHDGVTDDNVRITAGNSPDANEDKTQNSLFDYLVNKNKLRETVNAYGDSDRVYKVKDETNTAATQSKAVILVDNANIKVYKYQLSQLPANCSEGIIIATGDVEVNKDFKGLILAGGKISFATGVNVTADENLVADLYQEALKNDLFVNVIKDNYNLNTGSLGGVEIADYISYENWKKNEE